MARKKDPTEIAPLFTQDYQEIFGDQLISVILYGSAITDEYIPKKSDLNFLIVLSEESIETLHLVYDLVAKWRKKRVGTPLFLTKAYIDSSLDTFPIEFLNIKRNYTVVFGEDILERLSFEKEFIRMQCERELKGKLLLLRERYVETRGKAIDLRTLVTNTLSDFIFIFKGLLYLLNKEVPSTKKETVRIIADEFDLDQKFFLSLLKIKEGNLKPSGKEMDLLFQRYLKEIRKLTLIIDTWENQQQSS